MGKIRVKVIGEEDSEPKKKKTYEERKALRADAVNDTELEVKAVAKEEEDDEVAEKVETAPKDDSAETESPKKVEVKTVEKEENSSKKEYKAPKKAEKKVLSKRYASNFQVIDKNKTYSLSEAVVVLKEFKGSKFDETVELHINVKEENLSGTINLPHGTGKEVRIKIADDELIAEIEKGKVDFDVLIASPSMMPKLAKVAKVLGPRGLMPNPKNGTITDDPKPIIEKLSKGQIRFKTEPKGTVVHLAVGKVSFEKDKLSENIATALSSVGASKISKVTLKSTMSPGIKLLVS